MENDTLSSLGVIRAPRKPHQKRTIPPNGKTQKAKQNTRWYHFPTADSTSTSRSAQNARGKRAAQDLPEDAMACCSANQDVTPMSTPQTGIANKIAASRP